MGTEWPRGLRDVRVRGLVVVFVAVLVVVCLSVSWTWLVVKLRRGYTTRARYALCGRK